MDDPSMMHVPIILRRTRAPSLARVAALATCLLTAALLLSATQASGMASHVGWPHTTHHVGHPNNESGVERGLEGVHNMLLGGDGNDTIFAGNLGDVIWGDSHPDDPPNQSDQLHGGAGPDWIYASMGHNVIWTGAGNDKVFLVYGNGTVFCNGPGLKTLTMRYLASNRPWKLVGCDHTVIIPYRA